MLPTPKNGILSAAPGTPTVKAGYVTTPIVADQVGAAIATSPVESVLEPEAVLHITPAK